jgi:hypothetical protein
MNLIQIQENLKDLPTQVIMSYANGQNPEVPPYMALGELNRRKMSEQRRAEPPTQSVKEKLESESKAPPMPGAVPQGSQGPQGIAQLPAAQMGQAAPQEAPQPAPSMAGGGLAELPVRHDMFNYAPGGIVAFGGGGETDEDTAGEAEASAGMAAADQSQGPPVSAMQAPGLASLEGAATSAIAKAIRGDTDIPMPKDPELIRKEILDKNPELANLVNTIPGDKLAELSARLQAQNEASKAQFQEGQGRMGLAGLANALIAAGEATRGHKGLGFGEAMGGFGKSYGAFTAEDVKRQQAQQALERQQTIEVGKLNADIETLRQAYAKAQIEGRVTDAANYQKAIADRLGKIQELQVGASEKAISAGTAQEQMRGTIAHYKQLETNEALKLQEMISHNATQADIERQRNRMMGANYASEAAHRKAQDDLAEATKPSKEEKLDQQTQAKINGDKGYQTILKKLENVEINSDDYYNILEAARNIAITHYAPGMRLPPPVQREPKPTPKEEPGFFSRMFGGSPAPAPKVIKLD